MTPSPLIQDTTISMIRFAHGHDPMGGWYCLTCLDHAAIRLVELDGGTIVTCLSCGASHAD